MSSITTNLYDIIEILKRGDIAAIPTETVYGLAGNAQDPLAIQKIYAMKNRPLNHPLIMHVAKNADLSEYAHTIPDYVEILLHHFWPGPLTLVLPCRTDRVNPLVTAGQDTVAIRSPEHPLAQQLLEQLNFPLVAPSANPFGKVSPTTAQHVANSFKEEKLWILDGGRCPLGIESTIIQATDAKGYRILRHGRINETMLRNVLPDYALLDTATMNPIRISGHLKTHYQPEKPLLYFTENSIAQTFCHNHPNTWILSHHEEDLLLSPSGYQMPNNPEDFAYELYYQLRIADASATTTILIALPPDTSGWKGVREKIMKAGNPFKG